MGQSASTAYDDNYSDEEEGYESESSSVMSGNVAHVVAQDASAGGVDGQCHAVHVAAVETANLEELSAAELKGLVDEMEISREDLIAASRAIRRGHHPSPPIPRWCCHRTVRYCCCRHGGRHLPGILRRRRALCQRRQARHAHPVGLGPRPAFALPSRPRPAEGADILVLAVGHIAIRKGMGAGRGRGAVGRT